MRGMATAGNGKRDPEYRYWRWDGAHATEITDAETIKYLGRISTAQADSRGIHFRTEPNITATAGDKEPGGQCPGCPRCRSSER